MYYKPQIITYYKKNYFEEINKIKNKKIKFIEKKDYILIISEYLALTILDFLIVKTSKISIYAYSLLNKIIKNTNYLTNFIYYQLYIKYKIYKFKIKKILMLMPLTFFFKNTEEIKEYLKLTNVLTYANKKSKRFMEYSENMIRIKFLYMYIYDYFISNEYMEEYLNLNINSQELYFKFLKLIIKVLLYLNRYIINQYLIIKVINVNFKSIS